MSVQPSSVCRALGIPARSVTNFQSAHDSDCSMTIDQHRDEEGRPLPEYDESIWYVGMEYSDLSPPEGGPKPYWLYCCEYSFVAFRSMVWWCFSWQNHIS